MRIDAHRLLMNLRGAAEVSMREISENTGVHQAKLHRISKQAPYRLDLSEIIALTDYHLDLCPHLHTRDLLILEK